MELIITVKLPGEGTRVHHVVCMDLFSGLEEFLSENHFSNRKITQKDIRAVVIIDE